MTILLSGATGFVGINLLERLLGDGRRVVAFADRPLPLPASNALGRLPGELAIVTGDVRDRAAIEALMAEHAVSQVIHAAVITSGIAREASQGDVVVSVNLAGTAAMAQAAANHGVDRFLLVGSVAAFGNIAASNCKAVTEDMPQRPVTLYGIGKSASEGIAARIAGLHDMDYRIGRLGTVFGPWEHASGVRDTLSAVHQVVRAARAGRRIRLPRPAMKNWHYSRQVAASLITLLDAPSPRHRIYNLGPAKSWTLADWCSRLQQRLPSFQFDVGDGPGEPIELYESEDNAALSGDRFIAEFGRSGQFDLDAAFADYLDWIDRQHGWGIDD